MRKKCAVFLFVGAASVALASDVRVVEEIVAKVNNEIITRGEIEKTRRQMEAELTRQGLSGEKLKNEFDQLQKDALRNRIDELLLIQKGRDLSINVDTEIAKRLAQIQLEQKISDPDKFAAFVRENTGMSVEDFKQQMKDSLISQRVIGQEVGSRISIPRSDVEKYYAEHKKDFVREEQVMMREILISTEGKDEKGVALAEKKAKDLVARARKGEKFGDLARDNSDADTAKNYGELPAYTRKELDPRIAELVFKGGKGYITDPVKVKNGFEILKVEEKYSAGLQPIEAVENEIMDKLYQPKMGPAVRTYLTKLRGDAFLEIRSGYVDTGAAPGKDTAWKDPAKLKPVTVTKEEVAMRVRRKRLLWMVPVPGTNTMVKGKTKPESVGLTTESLAKHP